jgi:hypothetical protein
MTPTTRSRLLACVLAGVPLATSMAVALPAADAAPSPHLHVVNVLSKKFVGPLQFAVSGHHVYVADSFTSTLQEIGGPVLAHGPDPKTGGDIAGVAVNRHRHEIAYTSSNGKHTNTRLTVLQHGTVAWSVDLAKFEAAHNPDHKILYGIEHPTKCQRHGLKQANTPARYHGEVDSHPYAVTALHHGAWAVADAGANDLLRVSAQGDVSLIRLLPRETMVVSQQLADQEHLPQCVVGAHYRVEAVPTDVERAGHHGPLYVTTLPGADAANMGRVYRIHPGSGQRTKVGGGFSEATNLAVSKRGIILVAELGSGRISEVTHNGPVEVATLPGVVAVERANGRWYASTAPAVTGAQKPGQVVVLGT